MSHTRRPGHPRGVVAQRRRTSRRRRRLGGTAASRPGSSSARRSALGDPVADRLLQAVRYAGVEGLDLTARSRVFSGNVRAGQLDRATDRLLGADRIVRRTDATGDPGRPRTMLIAAEHLSRYDEIEE